MKLELASLVISVITLFAGFIAWIVSQSKHERTINEASRANKIAQSARDEAVKANTTATLAMEQSKHVFRVEKLTEIARDYNRILDAFKAVSIHSEKIKTLVNEVLTPIVSDTERYYLPMLESQMPIRIKDLKLKIIDLSESLVIYFFTKEDTEYFRLGLPQSKEVLEAASQERKKARESLMGNRKQLIEILEDVTNEINQILVLSTERASNTITE